MAHKALTHPAFGPCEPVPNLLAIKWRDRLEEAQRSAALDKLDLAPARQLPAVESRAKDAPDPRAVQVNASAFLSFASLARVTDAALKRIREAPEVEWVSQVYRAARATPGPLSYFAIDPTVLLVDLAAKDEALAAAKAADPEATADEERNRSLHGVAAIRLPGGNAIELRDKIVASGAAPAGAVRFENIPYISPIAGCCGEGGPTHAHGGVDGCAPAAAPAIPDDPLFGQQWGLARIDAPRAWPLTQGDPNVVVAVLDLGVELGHPDLHLWPVSYSTITHTNDGSPVGNHGTPCAGIISARTGNALGVAGLAGGCRVMAISTFFSDAQVAEGLYFAADNGARVVSMSFGVYPAWMVWDFTIIEAALQYCHERNMVLCAATGNENQPVSRFPATDPRTFGVGGSNRDDLRKSVGDTSIEGFWGACFGPDVDVVAPCLEIPATDRLGADGYTANDYTLRFNGTSSATPHVAALAGLLFSLDSGLGAADVRRIMAETCDKIGAGAYLYAPTAGKPYGTWNNEVGYGRINAERALLAACNAGRRPAGRCGVELPRPEACCVSPCDPPWRPDSQCMYSYETRHFRVPAVKQDNVASRLANLPYIEFRITYQHKLCLLGKQHGPLLFTVTLLPGERVTLYHSERYRRITTAQERFSVQTSFMQFLSLVHEARVSNRLDLLAERLSSAKGTASSTSGGGFFGGLFGFGGVSSTSGSASVTDHTRVSLTHVAELFAQSVMQASLLVEAERSLVVSTYEDKEQQDVSTRVIQNANECRAVTYFVRRVMELYAASTMVSDVSFRIVGADLPDEWHGVDDIEWLPAPVRDLFRNVVRLLPRVGTITRLPQPVTVPTDGAVYDPELAHCGSCEPQREAAVMLRLEQQKAEAMLACLKVREMELELERRKMLLEKGELGAFAATQPPAALPG